jgi:hypothetical protein
MIPRAVVTEVIKEIATIDSTFARDKIVHAFQPKNLKDWFANPHILVEYHQLENPRRLRLEQYEALYMPEILQKGKGLAGSITPFTKVDSIGFSQRSNVIWVKAVTMIFGKPVMRMLAGFIPTSDGLMKIYCYSGYDDYQVYERVFAEIVSSVDFTGENPEGGSFFESMNIVKILMTIIAAVFLVFFVIALKKNLF